MKKTSCGLLYIWPFLLSVSSFLLSHVFQMLPTVAFLACHLALELYYFKLFFTYTS